MDVGINVNVFVGDEFLMTNRIPFPNTTPKVKGEKRYRLAPGECSYCDEHKNDGMMPPHDASSACESGSHPHCTCDACY